MSNDLPQRVQTALARLPDWLRRDLSSKDDADRQRAEDTLSAMIVSVVREQANS